MSKNRLFDKVFRRKKDGLNFRRRRKKIDFNKVKYIAVFLVEIAFVILLGYLLVVAFGKQVSCSNSSMEPTYITDDTLLVNTIAYKIGSPERGEIIAFKPQSNVNASYSIKRIIGKPGETIQIKNGRIYINGERYKELIEVETINNPGIAASEITLGENQYFVLGDNRNNSSDSRFDEVSIVKRKEILGKAWLRIWPLSSFGVVEKGN